MDDIKPPRDPEPGNADNSGEAGLGQGLYRSVIVLCLLALVVLGVFFWQSRPNRTPGSFKDDTAAGTATAASTNAAALPQARFTDITASAGLRFVHDNGACGEKLLPETMGGGVAFFDYDQDGDPDLLFVNGQPWPECRSNTPAPPSPSPALVLYRNDTTPPGPVRFTEATTGSGLELSAYGMGVAVGDYDNDGWVDVFVTTLGLNHLFRNLGHGRFEEVTTAAGVGGANQAWSTSACWFDSDNDGDLDLFVCNYVQWSRELDLAVNYQLAGVGKAYGPPYDFAGSFPYFYRNDGQGRFTDITAASGLTVTNRATGQPLAKALGVTAVDLDDDGWTDIVVANDTVQNLVFHNQRNGTFAEIAASAGIAFDTFGGTRGAMGIDSARTGRENELSIAIGNFANEMTALYVAQPLPTSSTKPNTFQFSDEAIAQGIGSASRSALTFGVFFFDYDLDGWEDLLTVNGHIETDIQKLDPKQSYRQPAQLFWNAHDQSHGFVPVPAELAGADLLAPRVGRGSAFADIDGDGDLDIIITQIAGPTALLRNDESLGHSWLRIRLIGSTSNRDAIGAKIRFQSAGRTRWRRVMPTRGYLSQSELPLTLGLGHAATIDALEITWPGGERQSVKADRLNQTLILRQSP